MCSLNRHVTVLRPSLWRNTEKLSSARVSVLAVYRHICTDTHRCYFSPAGVVTGVLSSSHSGDMESLPALQGTSSSRYKQEHVECDQVWNGWAAQAHQVPLGLQDSPGKTISTVTKWAKHRAIPNGCISTQLPQAVLFWRHAWSALGEHSRLVFILKSTFSILSLLKCLFFYEIRVVIDGGIPKSPSIV